MKNIPTKTALIIAISVFVTMLVVGIILHVKNGGSMQPPKKDAAPADSASTAYAN